MKLSNKLKISKLSSLFVLTLFLFFISNSGFAQDAEKGEKVFKANCAACHKLDKKLVGPALNGIAERWEENSSIENMYAWIKNSQEYVKASGDPYAKGLVAEFNGSVMTAQAVSDEDIDNLLAYIAAGPAVAVVVEGTGVQEVVVEAEPSNWYWWVIAGLLLVVIFAVSGVSRELKNASLDEDGEPMMEGETFVQSTRRWLWKNFNMVFFFGFVLLIGTLTLGFGGLNQIGVFENYKPDQPIKYSHKLHAGTLGIECKYCHNSVEKSKTAGIPTVNVCMNCHKGVSEGKEYGTTEIQKIYDAAGFDPNTLEYSGETEPIRWTKVHNLPDHVYFNHSQHVKVGGLDCKQCHGDMTKETVARVMTTEDLNAVEDNKIKFTRPTLTMGWCLECHGKKEIDIKSAAKGSYYNEIHKRLLTDKETYQKYKEDGKVTVAELGGWECAKCHY
ncbi:cytochrome c3 family protein [Putridiphycobacter roseus]|nr:cytochrome c3 family protein [Putridiphycobacter roseus]